MRRPPRIVSFRRAGDVVHESVRERWERPDPRYRPRALDAFADLSGFTWDDASYT